MKNSTQLTQVLRRGMDAVAHRTMHDWSLFVKSTGISMPQFSILMQLHYHGTCAISQISERMDISNAAASQLVDKLVQAGLIERTEDPNDRRSKRIALADKGQELIQAGISERYRWVDALVESLDDEKRAKVAEAMQVLIETLQDMREKEQTFTENSH